MIRLLFRIARQFTRFSGARWPGWVFEHAIGWLPVQRLRDSDRLLVIFHPRPVYPFHVLLIPKQVIPGLQALEISHGSLLLEILQTASSLAEEYGLRNYRLVVNAGAFQNVPLLHFHLISDDSTPAAA